MALKEIEIHITDDCNLSCRYCYMQSKPKPHNNIHQRHEIINNFLEQYFRNSQKTNTLSVSFWGGEPLLEFDSIVSIVAKISEYKGVNFDNIDFLIITNGTLINDEIAQFCHDNNVRLIVTVDGDQKCHDAQRMYKNGHGSFDTIIQNLMRMKKWNAPFGVRITTTKKSPLPSQFVRDLKKYGIHGAYWGVITPITEYDYNELSPIDSEKIADDLFSSFLDDFYNNDSFEYRNITNTIREFFYTEPRKSCGISNSKVLLKYDGSLFPCHRMVDVESQRFVNISNGASENIYKKSIEVKYINNKCQKCQFSGNYCGGPCTNMILNHGINYIQDDFCRFQSHLRKKTFSFIIDLFFNDRNKFNELIDKYIGVGKEHIDINPIQVEPISDLSNISRLIKSPSAKCIDLGKYGILFLEHHFEKKIIANEVTMAIWASIDGSKTVPELVTTIDSLYNTENNAVFEEIKLMMNNGLIIDLSSTADT